MANVLLLVLATANMSVWILEQVGKEGGRGRDIGREAEALTIAIRGHRDSKKKDSVVRL